VNDALAAFIAQLAEQIAHERGWSLGDATRWIEQHVIDARDEYRQAGAPLGDTDDGFISWLLPRYQPPAA
jgi:hypothetical protein